MDLNKLKGKIQEAGGKWVFRDTLNTLLPGKAGLDWRCRTLKKDMCDYNMIKREYGNLVESAEINWENNEETLGNQEKIIWTCWFQGVESAPAIVKMCLASMKKVFPEFSFVILTDSNIKEYVKMPSYIEEKYRKGLITKTHYSDLVRVTVLEKYGGIWMDATVLCTSNKLVHELIEKEKTLFVFKDCFSLDPYTAMSSWFIYARKNNPYLKAVQMMLFEYWKREKHLCNYFLFHICFMVVGDLKKNAWNEIPTYSSQPPHIMQSELFDIFDENRVNELKDMTSIHKLSYKFSKENFEKKNTVYTHFIQEYCIRD